MKNRIWFILILLEIYFQINSYAFNNDSDFADSCSGEIEFECIDTVKVNNALPFYRFHYIVRQGCYYCNIHVGNHSDTLQCIVKVGLNGPSCGVKNIYVDRNFDGFLDLVIVFNRISDTKLDVEYWLFNQETGLFEFDQEYTNLITGKSMIKISESNQWNSWQLNFINKRDYGLRCAFDIDWKISDTRFSYGIGIPPFSISKSESEKGIRVASNYIVIVPGFLLNYITGNRSYFYLSALIVGIPNMHLSYEFVKEKFRFILAQRTDFYGFGKDQKIYSDISIGLLVRINRIALKPNISFPISRGYYNNRDPYIGFDLLYIN